MQCDDPARHALISSSQVKVAHCTLQIYSLEYVLKVDDALHLLDEHIRDLAEQDLHLGITAIVAGHGPDVA